MNDVAVSQWRAAALAELVLAKEQRCQEWAECTVVSAERTLANKHHCWKVAECSTTLAERVLANVHGASRGIGGLGIAFNGIG